MKYLLLIFFTLTLLMHCAEPRPVYESFEEYPIYPYDDLGFTYTPEQTTFKFWSPNVSGAKLRIYASDDPALVPEKEIELEEVDNAWTAVIKENLLDRYYTFQVTDHDGNVLNECADPYARALGVNGNRSQVIDLKSTDPAGWGGDVRPKLSDAKDIVIYELHVRDLSLHPSAGIKQKGKFLGLTETGTLSPQGLSTGLDHIRELGVTHVHLLPSFDYMSVDESRLDEPQFNWGYDPANYNVPEGSYSTDPADGNVRVREFKQMVKTLHDHGLRVIMDVVYNHTGRTEDSKFEQLIPGYFYRFNEDGSYSNASGCGNEIASERPMVRKYIRESVEYWVNEYHVDGFRFDLMGIHDIASMNEISQSLHAIDNSIFIYGEGWTAGNSPLPDSLRALKANTPQLERIAAFSDDIRDGMKGSVFHHEEKGFVSGAKSTKESIKYGVVGATLHPQVNYDSVNYSNAPWANQPQQCINYASCHDNHTLWDRLEISNPGVSESRREEMHRLSLAIVLTSQGVAFLHAGTELLRSKGGEENSYKSSDEVNAIDWTRKSKYRVTHDYVQGLIAMRKAHRAFRLRTTEAIQTHLNFLDTDDDELLVAYEIKDVPNDNWKHIVVAYNGNGESKYLDLPAGSWQIVANGDTVDEGGIGRAVLRRVRVDNNSAIVLVKK
ncbi:type I pullulanase [Lewinellaceae bacterium SD302]|nr:type I pullulanase [Lewinellaceae bacterium SD302]